MQDAGIKLSSVASTVLGESARPMLDAPICGTNGPEVLADLAKGALRKKISALREALHGRFTGHHALLIGQMLAQIDFLEGTIQTLSGRSLLRARRRVLLPRRHREHRTLLPPADPPTRTPRPPSHSPTLHEAARPPTALRAREVIFDSPNRSPAREVIFDSGVELWLEFVDFEQ